VSLVELARYYTSVEGEVVRLLLGSHGINAFLFDTGLNTAEGGGPITAVRLMVLEEEFDEARAILKADGAQF
jgi:hypothetical protein